MTGQPQQAWRGPTSSVPYSPYGPYRRGRRRRTPSLFVVGLITVLLVTLGAHQYLTAPHFAEPMAAPVFDEPQPDGRLLPPVQPTTSGPHVWIETLPNGQPVSYNPCRAITWFLNPEQMPPGAEPLVREAVGDISARTGLQFSYGGTTDLRPGGQSSTREPQTLLVSWADDSEVERLSGTVVGVGGSSIFSWDGDPQSAQFRAGAVTLDARDLAAILRGPNGREEVRLTILHELGHVVGLAHSDDPAELMYPQQQEQTGWGPGDLQGLAMLGQGTCQ